MKQFLLIILCLGVVLTGCMKKTETAVEKTPSKTLETKEMDPMQTLKIDENASSTIETKDKPNSTFTIPEYEAKVEPYSIENNLFNVENINQFTGFTKEQIQMLVKNGFVVLPSRATKLHYIYDSNEYSGIPNFITADSVLHTFHQFYDKSLLHIESNYLYQDLDLMTKQMLEKSISLYKALEDQELKALQAKNIVYFLIARKLMDPSAPISQEIDPELQEIAQKELKLIDEASTFITSPLLQIHLDYSQFKIRGHYTKSEELGRFFRTMIWFGMAPLSFEKNGKFNYENTFQALLMAHTAILETDDKSNTELWLNIYTPTSQYVGLSDDIDLYTMNTLRKSVFGNVQDPNIFNDEEYYDKLLEAVKQLPEPKIQGKLTDLSTPTGKQFRFMGQRYILDSYIMQNLMEPYVRPVPSGLDVMGVLGSHTAESHLFNEVKPQEKWPKYEEIYKKLKEEVSNYTDDIWGNNLYNGWLWTIQSAFSEYDENSGMPYFMTNEAWKNKSLNTALGSYTELKHDTILYGKQPLAEMGGSIEFAKQHYVEPNIPLYSKLLVLTDHTIEVLDEKGMLNKNMSYGAEEFKSLLKFLIKCSIKELLNEPLTQEENKQLLWYGGTLEEISNAFITGLTDDFSTMELADLLVSDVATIAPNRFDPGGNLSMGIGYFDQIYVVVPVNGKLYLTRGAVYSYYEFLSDTRLTDEEWWALNGIKKVDDEYGSLLEMTEPDETLPKQPFWVDTFKTDSNNVIIEPLEVNFEELNE